MHTLVLGTRRNASEVHLCGSRYRYFIPSYGLQSCLLKSLIYFLIFFIFFLSETLLMRWKGPLFPSRASVPCSSAPAVKFIFQGVFFVLNWGLMDNPESEFPLPLPNQRPSGAARPAHSSPGFSCVWLRSRSLWPRKAGPVLGVQIPVRAPRQVCG